MKKLSILSSAFVCVLLMSSFVIAQEIPAEKTTILTPLLSYYDQVISNDGSMYDDIDNKRIFLSDISTDFAKNEIQTLINYNILQGRADGLFKPNSNVSKAEYIKVLIRVMFMKEGLGDFAGESTYDKWYIPYLAKIEELGMMDGLDYLYNESMNGSVTKYVALKLLNAGLDALGYEKLVDDKDLQTIKDTQEYITRSQMARLLVTVFKLDIDKSWMTRSNNYDVLMFVNEKIKNMSDAKQKEIIQGVIEKLGKVNKQQLLEKYNIYIPGLIKQLKALSVGKLFTIDTSNITDEDISFDISDDDFVSDSEKIGALDNDISQISLSDSDFEG